jgi:hypothetical protein
MPGGFIARAFQRIQHVAPAKAEHSLHPWQSPVYGAKARSTLEPDAATALNAADKLRILEVIGTLLLYLGNRLFHSHRHWQISC